MKLHRQTKGSHLLSFSTQNIGLFFKIPLKFKQLVLTFAILLQQIKRLKVAFMKPPF